MRKALLLTVAAALLGFVGTAMAQAYWNFTTSAQNNVIVSVPTVLAMHITGNAGGSTAVVLSPTASDIANATSGSTFNTNTGGFQALIAFTNAKNGATITTSTTDQTGSADSASVLSDLYVTQVGNTGAQGLSGSATFLVSRGAPQTILDATSFSLALYPSPLPTPAAGFTYLITYTMAANP